MTQARFLLPHPILGGHFGPTGLQLRPIALVALRSLALVAIAMLLILVPLPAAIGAVGTQVASGA